MTPTLSEKLTAVRELYQLGALTVRVSDTEVFAAFAVHSTAAFSAEGDAPETEDERVAREEDELYRSADR